MYRFLCIAVATMLTFTVLLTAMSLVSVAAGDTTQQNATANGGKLQTLLQHVVGNTPLAKAEVNASDYKADGVVNSDDIRVIMAEDEAFAAQPTKTAQKATAAKKPTGLFGIDVSYAQGEIDWVEVKKSGAGFAILRCGYGQDQTDQDDDNWDFNAAECERLGIPYGAYFFCYARSVKEAEGEAKHALRLLKGKNLSMPIFLDMEYSSYQGDLENDEYAAIAKKFCTTLTKAGYRVGVYANLDWWENRLTDPCFDNWFRWVAQYNDECQYEGDVHIWQYTEDEIVPGITENSVDANYCYVNFVDMPVERKK